MKKLMLLILVCFAFTLLLSNAKIYAAGTTWTGNIVFPIKLSQETLKGKTEVVETTTLDFTGTATLTTDANGDPVLSGGSPDCFLKIAGTVAPGTVATTICIDNLAIVSLDTRTGEKAGIVGTGTITEGANNGLIFLQANWSQVGTSPITSISLSVIKMMGGWGVLTGNGGGIIGITVPGSAVLE